jgi:hypothetical protein
MPPRWDGPSLGGRYRVSVRGLPGRSWVAKPECRGAAQAQVGRAASRKKRHFEFVISSSGAAEPDQETRDRSSCIGSVDNVLADRRALALETVPQEPRTAPATTRESDEARSRTRARSRLRSSIVNTAIILNEGAVALLEEGADPVQLMLDIELQASSIWFHRDPR